MAEQFGSNPWPGMPSTVEQSYVYASPALATLPPHPADAPAQPLSPPRRQRVWPAVLTLFLLAPIVGEVLSGSTAQEPSLCVNWCAGAVWAGPASCCWVPRTVYWRRGLSSRAGSTPTGPTWGCLCIMDACLT